VIVLVATAKQNDDVDSMKTTRYNPVGYQSLEKAREREKDVSGMRRREDNAPRLESIHVRPGGMTREMLLQPVAAPRSDLFKTPTKLQLHQLCG
jgi:hypothetical protein